MIYRRMRLFLTFFLALRIVIGFGSLFAQQTAGELFEKALYVEEAQGDLEKAIGLYQQILRNFSENREVCAKAQLQVGLCYEKLGNTEAIKAYEKVLKDFADRPEQVAVARERLAALKQETPVDASVVNLPKGSARIYVAAVSPDGTKLLGTDENGENVVVHDTVADRTDSLTKFDSSIGSPMAYNPVWSPDGTQIAYVQFPDKKQEKSEIRVSDLLGNSKQLLSIENEYVLPVDWLTDGSAILFFRVRGEDSISLCSVPANGGSFMTICPLRTGSSNLSASASPDGRFVVLCEGARNSHDLRIVSMDGRISQSLTDHPGDDRDPLWSPDGKYVIFRSDRQGGNALWGQRIRDGQAEGQPFLIEELLPRSYTLNWTNRGLAVYRWVQVSDIYIQSIDSGSFEPKGNPQILPSDSSGRNTSFRWSPDGGKIAYVTRMNEDRWRLTVLSNADGNSREYAAPNQFWISEALVWNPDGSGLGFGTWPGNSANGKTNIFRLDFASGEWKPVVLPKVLYHYVSMEWSRDPGSIFYTRSGVDENSAGAGVVEHNLNTGLEKLIYRPAAGKNHFFYGIRLSRDLKTLAIRLEQETEPNSGRPYQIVLLELDTGQARAIHSSRVWIGDIAWSPDGQHILASIGREAGEGTNEITSDLTIIPVTQGPPKKLKIAMSWPTERGLRHEFGKPDWSPDGKQIAFTAISSKEEIFLMKNFIPKDQR